MERMGLIKTNNILDLVVENLKKRGAFFQEKKTSPQKVTNIHWNSMVGSNDVLSWNRVDIRSFS